MIESLPALEPPSADASPYARHLPRDAALQWLRAGFADFLNRPGLSLAYGGAVLLLSVAVLGGLWGLGFHYMMLPALAGFLLVGPMLAIGLYRKSARLAAGQDVRLRDMLLAAPRSGGQVAFAGATLCLLAALWLRAADLLYALFFGMLPFRGFDEILHTLLTTPRGWALIATGTAIGGLFAAFTMAIGFFSFPMLVERRTDALTAFGVSFALTNKNLAAVLPWGVIVTLGFALCVASGLLGLIVVFPVLGHGSWHAWRAVRPAEADVADR